MITEQNILDMYTHLRTTNTSIPNEVIDFMKKTCLETVNKDTETYVGIDFDLKVNDTQFKKRITQRMNGHTYKIQISKIQNLQ